MEIYRELDASFDFTIRNGITLVDPDLDNLSQPVLPVVSYIYRDNSSVLATVTRTTVGKFKASFGRTFAYDEELQVTITYTLNGILYTKRQVVSIVTPYVSIDELIDSLGNTYTYDEIKYAERLVRGIINTYCHQSFGYFVGPIVIFGGGEEELILPRRLNSYTTISNNGVDETGSFVILGEGAQLARPGDYFGTIKQDVPSRYFEHGVVINAPAYGYAWATNVEYTITGDWGFRDVPDSVQQAAKLLIEDYACPQATYRAKYLKAVRAADWRYDFDSTTFLTTGSVYADQLLEPWCKEPNAVII